MTERPVFSCLLPGAPNGMVRASYTTEGFNPVLTGQAAGSNMILKGNQCSGGQQLAAHLLNSFDNERVEIVDVRGAVAQDLSGAFAEWAAEARGTRCQKFLYSLSLNPDQTQGHLTRAQYLELLERTERSLKLVGQPRAVVFHEKRDKDGILREHCHAVWSRIDTDRMKAVQISHDRLKLRTVAQ